MGSVKIQSTLKSKENRIIIANEEDSPQNINYDQSSNIVAASKSKLFEKLCVGTINKKTFINTYPLFAKQTEVIDQLVERFCNHELYDNRIDHKEACTHILETLYLWLTVHPMDFKNDTILSRLQQFAYKAESIPDFGSQIKQFQKLLADKLNPHISTDHIKFPDPLIPSVFGPGKFCLFDIKPIELARQLCLEGMAIWSTISPREFFFFVLEQQRTG